MYIIPIFYVYVLFRPWDGSPFYVGKGKGRRWLNHEREGARHPNKHLANILKKAARLGLEIPKIKVQEGLLEDKALEVEVALIAAIGRDGKGPLVNLTDGGDGVSGRIVHEEERAHKRALYSGKSLSDERCEAISAAQKGKQYSLGRKHTDETKSLIGAKSKANWEDEEYRSKILSKRKTQGRDPETLAKRSRTMKAQWADPIGRTKLMAHRA